MQLHSCLPGTMFVFFPFVKTTDNKVVKFGNSSFETAGWKRLWKMERITTNEHFFSSNGVFKSSLLQSRHVFCLRERVWDLNKRRKWTYMIDLLTIVNHSRLIVIEIKWPCLPFSVNNKSAADDIDTKYGQYL